MSYRGRNRAIQLVVAEVSVDLQSTHYCYQHEQEQRHSANETIVIDTDKLASAVNCPIKVVIVPLNWLLSRRLMIHKAHTAVISTRTQTDRQRKRENVIVTHKICSAVNCPIEDGIVPISWLALRYLLISQNTHCRYQHTNTNKERARKRKNCYRH